MVEHRRRQADPMETKNCQGDAQKVAQELGYSFLLAFFGKHVKRSTMAGHV